MAWTYDDLKGKVADYLGRSDLASKIDDAILLFESDYNLRPGMWRRLETATITTVAGTATASLPADFERMVSISRVGYPDVTVTSLEGIKAYRTLTQGSPRVAAVYSDGLLLFGPTPDDVYSYELAYYPRLSELSSSNTTNWLINKYPQVYLYGTLSYLLEYVRDTDRAAFIRQQHETQLLMLNNNAILPESGATMVGYQQIP